MGDSRRRVEERLALRFPRIMALGARHLFRQHPRSRLRRTIVPRVVRSGVQAASRGDFEAAFAVLALLERRVALREIWSGFVRRF
jgi:hypothetical protein